MMERFDVVVVGAGPVGSVAALAHARRGARVLLLEANPQAAGRFAGEWLHPPALEALARVGVTLPASARTGKGFVVFPDDGSAPQRLPYADDAWGLSCEHHALVDAIRSTAAACPGVTYEDHARVVGIEGQRVTYTRRQRRGARRARRVVRGDRIIGADGRSSIVREALDLPVNHMTSSRMAGLLLRDVTLPAEDMGHVFLGGPGPVLAYRIAPDRVRVCVDVPLWAHRISDRNAWMYEAYGPLLPPPMREALLGALRRGEVAWASNQIRPRVHYGRDGLALVGDAVGHHHPLTAAGMTLGFGDAITLAEAPSFEAYRRARLAATRVPEALAVALYEVFADASDETVAMRQAIYGMWRRSEAERVRTMRFLACQDTRATSFLASFLRAMSRAGAGLGADAVAARDPRFYLTTGYKLARRTWLLGLGLIRRPTSVEELKERAHDPHLNAALNVSLPVADVVDLHAPHEAATPVAPAVALERAAGALARLQRDDGAWEGEVVWCPMLPAQYVLMCHLIGRPIDATRRRRLLRQFERAQLPGGLWGLHRHSEPYLFVTGLVYVAARLLGVCPDAPMMQRARRFIHAEGGLDAIPSWGKLWLALVGLYDWRGVHAILPEAWALPRWVPVHPANYYCHTRLIYLAMASLSSARVQGPITPLIDALRAELYPGGYARVDWKRARGRLREGDLHTPPSPWLRALYTLTGLIDRVHPRRLRARLIDDLRERIRWELQSTDHTSISPVNGLLNIIALWHHNPDDPDMRRALERFEAWIWEDDVDGLRVAGACSASWDTAFAVQALAAARPHLAVEAAIEAGAAFLRTQQLTQATPGWAAQHRVDPRGGWCFAGAWHGWPVSDCTAEAMLALLESPPDETPRTAADRLADAPTAADLADLDALQAGARFLLRCQNHDGGFGSYEAARLPFSLEWLNPAEMFGDAMTERSYVECTASCIAALVSARPRLRDPDLLTRADHAIARAARRLRLLQRPDGAWDGVWGVRLVYGTLFGVRGLLAAGADVFDPAIQKATRWLLSHQRPDGGWGERHHSPDGAYCSHETSQTVQTAWALTTLLEARCPDWASIERAADFLAATQRDDGEWPPQRMVGVFFHAALLDYTLYRHYFPLQALGLYESRRKARLDQGWSAAPARHSRATRHQAAQR